MVKQLEISDWKLTENLSGISVVTFKTPNDDFHRTNINVTKRVHVTFHERFTGYVSRYKPRESVIEVTAKERAFRDLERLPFVYNGAKRFDFENVPASTLIGYILSGTSWYGQDIPDTLLTIKFNHKSKHKAIVAVAKALKADFWYDSLEKHLYIGHKGKKISESISALLEIEAEFTDDDLLNDIDLLGEGTGALQTEVNKFDLSSVAEHGTYWMALGNAAWNNAAWMGDYAEMLIDDLKMIKGPIKGKIPYPTYIQYQLKVGDVVPLNQPEKDISGRFRITKLVISLKGVIITLDPKLEPGALLGTIDAIDMLGQLAERINQMQIGKE